MFVLEKTTNTIGPKSILQTNNDIKLYSNDLNHIFIIMYQLSATARPEFSPLFGYEEIDLTIAVLLNKTL